MDLNSWRVGMQRTLRGHPHSLTITKTLMAILRYIEKTGWSGACHASSAVVFVLLREQGVGVDLCLGEALLGRTVFNHSWVELDGKVFDVAIVHTLENEILSAPVVMGRNVETGNPTEVQYGVKSGQPDDPPTAMLRETSFVDYLDEFPGHHYGLWGLAVDLAAPLGLQLDAAELRGKYADTHWLSR